MFLTHVIYPDQQVDFSNAVTTTINSKKMPVIRGSRSNYRHNPSPGYTVSASVRDPVTGRMGPPRRRGLRHRKRARNAIVNVPRSKLAFPSGMRTKLRFCQRVSVVPDTLNGIVHYAYRANALTDPDATGSTNHQPRGFDEFMGVYRTYTVLGSKIMVNWTYDGYDGPAAKDTNTSVFLIKTTDGDAGSASGGAVAACPPVMVGIHKGVTEVAAGSAAQTMEQDRTVWRPMTQQDGAVTIGSGMRTSDFFGKGSLVGAEGYTGSITADPDNIIYFCIWAARIGGTTAGVCMLNAHVTIEYDVQFTESKTLGES